MDNLLNYVLQGSRDNECTPGGGVPKVPKMPCIIYTASVSTTYTTYNSPSRRITDWPTLQVRNRRGALPV